MKFWRKAVDDWLQGTVELSFAEQGAYDRFLCLSWSRDGHMPDDDRLMARMMCCDIRTWKKMKSRLLDLGKLEIEGGIIFNSRAKSEQLRVRSKSEVARQSAEKRWRNKEDYTEKPNENKEPTKNSHSKRMSDLDANRKPLAVSRTGTDVPVEKARAKGTRLSIESLPPDWRDWALANDPNRDPAATWERFHDHWIAQPGQKGVKTDWQATWRNWWRREPEFAPKGTGPPAEHPYSKRISDQQAGVRRLVEDVKRGNGNGAGGQGANGQAAGDIPDDGGGAGNLSGGGDQPVPALLPGGGSKGG